VVISYSPLKRDSFSDKIEDMYTLIIFIFGLLVGSFLNSVVCRLEKGEGIAMGRSYCPKCEHKLGILNLIPILSFLMLKGACRYCKKKISAQYPLVELGTAVLFAFGFTRFFPDLLFIIHYLLFTSFLIVIFIYDLKYYIIPDKIVYSAIALAVIFRTYEYSLQAYGITPIILSTLGAAGFFAIIHFGSQGKWMGFGDVKLALLMGLLLGWPGILIALFLSFFFGAVIGTVLIVFGKKGWKSEVPFGPFLITGLFVALFFGQALLDSYIRFFSVL